MVIRIGTLVIRALALVATAVVMMTVLAVVVVMRLVVAGRRMVMMGGHGGCGVLLRRVHHPVHGGGHMHGV